MITADNRNTLLVRRRLCWRGCEGLTAFEGISKAHADSWFAVSLFVLRLVSHIFSVVITFAGDIFIV